MVDERLLNSRIPILKLELKTFCKERKMILTSILTILLFIFDSGLWCFPPNFDARSYTHEIFYITGAIAWLWMTICLVIAARPSWIEKVFRSPLDRLYVFHKWLGFAAVAMAFVHYFVKDIFGPILRLIWTLPKPPKKRCSPIRLFGIWCGL